MEVETEKKVRKSVPAAEFVRAAWESFNAGEGLKGIAARTGQESPAISTRLSSLKKKKVKLPTFKSNTGNNKLNIDELNEIAGEFAA